jgi:hypothetical protein
MTLGNTARAQAARQPSFTLRLTFAYDSTGIRLINSQRIEMIAPPAVTPAPQAGQAGYWVELRNAQGELLYHHPLSNPLQVDFEVFSNDPKQPLMRVPNPNPKGEFTVLVPDVSGAATFILNGPPTGAATQFEPSKELLRLTLDQIRRP